MPNSEWHWIKIVDVQHFVPWLSCFLCWDIIDVNPVLRVSLRSVGKIDQIWMSRHQGKAILTYTSICFKLHLQIDFHWIEMCCFPLLILVVVKAIYGFSIAIIDIYIFYSSFVYFFFVFFFEFSVSFSLSCAFDRDLFLNFIVKNRLFL